MQLLRKMMFSAACQNNPRMIDSHIEGVTALVLTAPSGVSCGGKSHIFGPRNIKFMKDSSDQVVRARGLILRAGVRQGHRQREGRWVGTVGRACPIELGAITMFDDGFEKYCIGCISRCFHRFRRPCLKPLL